MSRPTTPTSEFFSNFEGFLKKFRLTTENQKDQEVLTLANLDSGRIRKFIVKKVDEKALFGRRNSQKSLKDENENKSKKSSFKKDKKNDGKRRMSSNSLQSLKASCSLKRFGSSKSLASEKNFNPDKKKRRSSFGSGKFKLGWGSSSESDEDDDIFECSETEMTAAEEDRNGGGDSKDPGFANEVLVKEEFEDEGVEVGGKDEDAKEEETAMVDKKREGNDSSDAGSLSSLDTSSPSSSPRFKLKMSPVPKRTRNKKSDPSNSPVSFRGGYQSNRSSISSVRKGILKKTNSCTTINMEMSNLSRPQTPTNGSVESFEEDYPNGETTRFTRTGDNPHLRHQRSFNRVKFILDSGRPDNITGDYDDIKIEKNDKSDRLDKSKMGVGDPEEKGLTKSGRKCLVFSAGLLIMTMAVILGSFYGSRKGGLPPKALATEGGNFNKHIEFAVEGRFRIMNENFYEALYNHESPEFRRMSKAIEDVMVKAIFMEESANQANSTIRLRIVKYEEGSVITLFRIKWEQTPTLELSEIRKRILKHLQKYGAFGEYKVDRTSFSISELRDYCDGNTQSCSHICVLFDETLRFGCTCPDNLILVNNTNCISPKLTTTTAKNPVLIPGIINEVLRISNANLLAVNQETIPKDQTPTSKKKPSTDKEDEKTSDESSGSKNETLSNEKMEVTDEKEKDLPDETEKLPEKDGEKESSGDQMPPENEKSPGNESSVIDVVSNEESEQVVETKDATKDEPENGVVPESVEVNQEISPQSENNSTVIEENNEPKNESEKHPSESDPKEETTQKQVISENENLNKTSFLDGTGNETVMEESHSKNDTREVSRRTKSEVNIDISAESADTDLKTEDSNTQDSSKKPTSKSDPSKQQLNETNVESQIPSVEKDLNATDIVNQQSNVKEENLSPEPEVKVTEDETDIKLDEVITTSYLENETDPEVEIVPLSPSSSLPTEDVTEEIIMYEEDENESDIERESNLYEKEVILFPDTEYSLAFNETETQEDDVKENETAVSDGDGDVVKNTTTTNIINETLSSREAPDAIITYETQIEHSDTSDPSIDEHVSIVTLVPDMFFTVDPNMNEVSHVKKMSSDENETSTKVSDKENVTIVNLTEIKDTTTSDPSTVVNYVLATQINDNESSKTEIKTTSLSPNISLDTQNDTQSTTMIPKPETSKPLEQHSTTETPSTTEQSKHIILAKPLITTDQTTTTTTLKSILNETISPNRSEFPVKEIVTVQGILLETVTKQTPHSSTSMKTENGTVSTTTLGITSSPPTANDSQIDLGVISKVSHDLSVQVGQDPPQNSKSSTSAPTIEPSNIQNNVSQSSANATSPPKSPCTEDEFECKSGECVTKNGRCDSVVDCFDRSDEEECIENGCLTNYQCRWSGDCLQRRFVCDGIKHCTDGDDEEGCETWKCTSEEFHCGPESTSSCIPLTQKCDSHPDCFNRTDELNCEITECPKDRFLCPEGNCIPNLWKCDGMSDCLNGEDELNCGCEGLDQSTCSVGGCVPTFKVCDGLRQCPDGSDEWGCLKIDNKTKQLQVRSSGGRWSAVCGDKWTAQWTDLVCEQLGLGISLSTEVRRVTESTLMPRMRLSPDAAEVSRRGRAPLQYFLTHGECEDEPLVHVSCKMPECGKWNISKPDVSLHNQLDREQIWPSLGLLIQSDSHETEAYKDICTASIITPTWVLTSYSCLASKPGGFEAEKWVLLAGEPSPRAGNDNTQLKYAKQIVVYPGAKRINNIWIGDVALLRLHTSLTFSSSIQPICFSDASLQSHDPCVIASWKPSITDANNREEKSPHLSIQALPIPNLTVNTCNTSYYEGQLHQGHTCASFLRDKNSPCTGNEGSPLMCRKPGGSWHLHGLLSHAGNCANFNLPSIFTDITTINSWLLNTLGRTTSKEEIATTTTTTTTITTTPTTTSSSSATPSKSTSTENLESSKVENFVINGTTISPRTEGVNVATGKELASVVESEGKSNTDDSS